MDTMGCFMNRIVFLVAVVCVTASANLMLDYNWPEPNSNIIRFPHESSCHYYYLMLSEEDISVEKCPDGQLFDYVKHNCLSEREHIHCFSRHFGKIKHGHFIKHKKHFKCPYPWGKYPHLHDCKKYHLCLNGKSSVKKCAPFELFDKVSRKCIASIDAVCADKTDVVEYGYECPKMWGSFTYSKDCSKYYECLQKKPSLRTCQKGFLFDSRLGKCSPKEHVYCGVRHNPYETVNTDAPEISSGSTSFQKSTTPDLDVIETKEIASEKPVSQEVTSAPEEASSTSKEVTSAPEKASSTFKEVTSAPEETSSTFKEVTSAPEEASSTSKEVTSVPQETSSTFKGITLNQPITSEISSPSAVPEDNAKEIKQESSIVTANPAVEIKEKQQETSVVTEDVSETKELVETSSTTEKEGVMISSQIASDDESGDMKKDVSTEEKDTEDVSTKLVKEAQENEGTNSAATTDSKTGCLPEDFMCVTEKDGTIVKCSSSKDLQPHPKDERRFLDCTGSKIQIYTCPPNLTFIPTEKKCRWQFIMGSK